MQLLHPTLLPLCLLALTPFSLGAHNQPNSKPPSKDAILLSRIRTLTLRANARTAHRRLPSVPELTCTGPGCAHYNVDVMRCKNQGSAYAEEDVEWTCTASLPEEFKLGSTDVSCEGYASKDDDFVLKGSCGVEYRLLLTDKGEEKYGKPGFWGGGSRKGNAKGSVRDEDGWTFSSILFAAVFLGVAAWILWAMYRSLPPAGDRILRRPGGGWGGGGGPDDPWDPPPPYPGKRYNYGRQQEGWRPGFWSGALGGAAAGYAAGARANRQQPAPQRNQGWFGGNSGGDFTAPSRISPSPSSTRHESTGFGSSSRR